MSYSLRLSSLVKAQYMTNGADTVCHERQLPAPVDRAVGDVVPAAYDFVGAMCETIEVAERNIVKAQQRQESFAVSRHRGVQTRMGVEVLFSARNYISSHLGGAQSDT